MAATDLEEASMLTPARFRRVGDLLFTGAVLPLDSEGNFSHPGDAGAQAGRCFERLGEILEENDGDFSDVVSLTSFHADPRDIPATFDAATGRFGSAPPAWTPVGFIGTNLTGALVNIRAVAHLGGGEKESILPESQAWRRSYPMAAACRKENLLFIAGQSAADASGQFALPLDHCAQARTAYRRIEEILEIAGGSLDDVLDFASFHLDIRGAIPTLETVYAPEVIGAVGHDEAPTTSHIGSTGLLVPEMLGAYGATADLDPSPRVSCTPETITWNDNGAYPISGAARKRDGKLITVAGQVSAAADGVLHPGDSEAQLRFIFEEIRDSIAGLGASMSEVTEVMSFHKDVRAWDLTRSVAAEFFDPASPPTWTFTAVPGLWKEGYMHEISAFAHL